MSNSVQTWHYGLMAQHWAERNTTGPEIAYFQQQIERYGQPALDAGCGTRRLLIPFLHAGLDVDGCDVSGDMLLEALALEALHGAALLGRLIGDRLAEHGQITVLLPELREAPADAAACLAEAGLGLCDGWRCAAQQQREQRYAAKDIIVHFTSSPGLFDMRMP